MAVRDRTYRPYEGELTGALKRLTVIPRFAYEDILGSRLLLVTLAGAMVWPAACVVVVYLHHNVAALTALALNPLDLLAIDSDFFRLFFDVQAFFGFVLVFLAAPSLISMDLAHGALPLYLARPFSRLEYLIGKLLALGLLLSAISWVPGLLLFGFQVILEGRQWALDNLWLGVAIALAGLIGIAFVSLVGLAISAWVRWRALARGVFLGLFVFFGILSGIVRELLGTDWAAVLNPALMLNQGWALLFRAPLDVGLPEWAVWASLGGFCAVSLLLLSSRLRAYEVVA